MKRTNITKTLTELYGSGHYNPRAFERRSPGRRRLYAWGLSLLLAVLVLATALGLYLFARTPASFTGERVRLSLLGPTSVRIGEEESYQLQIKNEEEVDLTDAEIFIGYNQGGAVSANTPSVVLVRAGEEAVSGGKNTWFLGGVKSGESKEFPLTLRFSGASGSEFTLPLSLRFRQQGFTSDFSLKLEQKITLGSSLFQISLLGPEQASPGSEVTYTIAVARPAEASGGDLTDWRLNFIYPGTFQNISFEPALAGGASDWRIGDLPLVNESYQLLARGKVSGALGEKLILAAELKGQEAEGATIREEKTITIQSSAAQITLSATPSQGKKLQWDEAWRFQVLLANTGAAALQSGVVSVSLVGEEWWQSDSLAIESGGFFEGGNIIWDQTTTPALANLAPGQSQSLRFSLKTRAVPPVDVSGAPAILAKGKFRAKLENEEIMVESSELTAKILSNIDFDTTAAWREGPRPPLPAQPTTYTITWQLNNTSSDLKDLRLTAALGRLAQWVERSGDYTVGELSYNQAERTIEWRASKIPKLTAPLAISFAIDLVADEQPANNLVLLGQSTLEATDALANESLELYTNAVRLGDVRQ